VVDMLSHWVGVLYKGKLVEEGIGSQVMGNPQDAYTKPLIATFETNPQITQQNPGFRALSAGQLGRDG